ncbi:cation:proton antiporter [Candidatus Woesearchaeota archaeon]|nr:cation:proton antiporter [Candidatus Woesearchaeota archaeon]
MVTTLAAVIVSIVLAFALSEVCVRLKIPRVIGQIAAGMVLSISLFKTSFFTPSTLEIFSFLAYLGTIFLFFFVGMEIDMRKFRKHVNQAALISILNTAIPFTAGVLLGIFVFHFEPLVAVIIGISLAVSSQAISLDVLDEFRLIKTRIGGLVIAAGAVDDIFELILISGILMAINATSNISGLFEIFASGIIFILIIIIFRRFLVPFIIDRLDEEKNPALLFAGAVMISLMMAGIAEYLGLDALIGALIAGVLVRQTFLAEGRHGIFEEHSIAKVIHTLAFGFLVPLFFVWVGLNTNVSSMLHNLGFGLVLTAVAILGTVGGTMLAVMLSKGSALEGMTIGWGVNPKGDVELVIATLALQNYLITVDIFSAIILMALLTTLISPIVFRFFIRRFYARQQRAGAAAG